MTVEQVEADMRKGTIPPHMAADYRVLLAGEYSFTAGQLEDILKRKPSVWLDLRKGKKSDASTDRAYEMTEDGVNEIGLRLRLKKIEKMSSALGSLIKVAEGEANQKW